jgi:hypothetical protein
VDIRSEVKVSGVCVGQVLWKHYQESKQNVNLVLVGVQVVRWKKGGTEPADSYMAEEAKCMFMPHFETT